MSDHRTHHQIASTNLHSSLMPPQLRPVTTYPTKNWIGPTHLLSQAYSQPPPSSGLTTQSSST